MIHPEDLTGLVMNEAKMPGATVTPQEVLDCIEGLANPIRAIGERNNENRIFDALQHHYGFIHHRHFIKGRLTSDQHSSWVGLMRWFFQAILEWRKDSDPNFHNLTAIFAIATFCDDGTGFWDQLPDELSSNTGLLETLAELLSAFDFEFVARYSMREPIWEREIIEQLAVAEENEDLWAFSALWSRFEHSVIPHAFQTQFARCLRRFNFGMLAQATEGITKTSNAMLVAAALAPTDSFRLASTVRNARVKFACIYQPLRYSPRRAELDEQAEFHLSLLLVKVAEEMPQWAEWMRIFNRYPLRYPTLQRALGHALTKVSNDALQVYVNSIPLNISQGASREAVTNCLRAFQGSASAETRQVLWAYAYRRWTAWRFNEADPERYLSRITGSEIDYAVVGYLAECSSGEERVEKQAELIQQLFCLDNHWHDSKTTCMTRWYSLLSELQLYAHADKVVACGAGLFPTKIYIPADIDSTRYLQLMYSGS